MQINNKIKNLIIGITTVLIGGLMQNNSVEAQISSPPIQKDIIQLEPATVRTPQEMQRDNFTFVNQEPQAIPFRPTIDPATYQQLKAAAEQERTSDCSQRQIRTKI